MASELEARRDVDQKIARPAIVLQGVSMTFGSGQANSRVRALDSIDLEVGSGEFVSLIGPSGCGKSTLLRLIGDLLQPSAGLIQYYGPANAYMLWGAIVVATLLGLFFFRVVALAERLVLKWQPEFRLPSPSGRGLG